jgi:DNA modification methylase
MAGGVQVTFVKPGKRPKPRQDKELAVKHEIRRVTLAEWAAAPYNPRTISDEALAGLGASLDRFGLVEPLVVNARTKHIVGGHQRARALKAAGETECDAVVVDLDEAEERALNVTLNNPKIAGDWTGDARSVLDQLEVDLGDAFEALELDSLRDSLAELFPDPEPEPVTEEEVPEPPANPVTKPGDVWTLGDHRLVCGDSTDADSVAKLMDGKKASLFATDPPYLVDYQGGNHPQSWANKADVKDKHWDDYTDPEKGSDFFAAYLAVGLKFVQENVAVYQWFATKRHVIVEDAWERNGLLAHQEIVWVKARAVLTRCHFMWKYEPCLYGWVKGKPPKHCPPSNETTVWEIDQKGECDGIHPTQKPVAIFARPIEWHTRKGDIVYEPFSGSGTQIIAAEQLGRRCFAMELSPAFVDVAVERWQNLTGGKATR